MIPSDGIFMEPFFFRCSVSLLLLFFFFPLSRQKFLLDECQRIGSYLFLSLFPSVFSSPISLHVNNTKMNMSGMNNKGSKT
eukprot:m.9929 g.9929  ORF g.9929 m.9929 type:complete len:81 (-) comp5865_c0_seq1:73-315(-)